MDGFWRFAAAAFVSAAIHVALVNACGGWFAQGKDEARVRADELPKLDLSSVDLSFSEREDESAPVQTAPAAAPDPDPVQPPPVAPPPSERPLVAPPEPDLVVVRETPPSVRPVELRPQDPEAPVSEPVEREEKPSTAEAKPVPSPAVSQPDAAPSAPAPDQARLDVPKPSPAKEFKPRYPTRARERGEQGDVLLDLEIDALGFVTGVRIGGGCGFAALEEAAMKAVRKAKFIPAKIAGVATNSTTRLTVSFRLRE